MEPPFPSPVKTWHNDTYPSVSPKRPELSARGKTVVITGAGGVIGRQTALAFIEAGAKHVALVGRTVESLKATQDALPIGAEVSVHQADVAKAEDMKIVADAVGTWDVLILGAAYVSKPGHIATASADEQWEAFETNTKSVILAVQAFTPSARTDRAVILGLFSGAVNFPAEITAGLSAYLVSKMAQAKLLEYVSVENKKIFTASIHPGMIDSPLFRASGATPDALPMDTAQLPAHFLVWMASPEASDLCGKLVWANWDVDELKAVAAQAKSSPQHTLGSVGWPFSHS